MAAAGALILMGCKPSGDVPSVTPTVPDIVQHMMAVEFPADGQVHVHSSGKFHVEAATAFCTFPGSFGISSDAWNDLFVRLDQPTTAPEGHGRANGPVEGCDGSMPKSTIKDMGVQLSNREGEPYKLALAVWQGDPAAGGAYWVGGVERLGRLNPKIEQMGTPQHGGRRDQVAGSLILDHTSLSKVFVRHVIKRESR